MNNVHYIKSVISSVTARHFRSHSARFEDIPHTSMVQDSVGVEYSAKSQPSPTKPHNVDVIV